MDNQRLAEGCAGLIKDLRLRQGLSKSKMALELMVDPHTLAKWENGESAPTVPEFLAMFDHFGESALRNVLDMLYPDIYKGLTPESDPEDIRNALVHYFANSASEREVRNLSYIIFGKHGSNFEPQLQECIMVEHLPIDYRYTIAELIDTLYRLAEARDLLIQLDHVLPDVELFRSGLKKARESIINGNDGYTTSMEGL